MTKDRQTGGLVPPIVIVAISLSVLLGMWALAWPVARGHALVVHGSAGLCLIWSLAGCALIRRAKSQQSENLLAQAELPRDALSPDESISEVPPPPSATSLRDWLSVLNMAALTLGALAVIVMAYHAVIESVLRTLSSLIIPLMPMPRAEIWPGGIVDLGLLAVALGLGRLQTGNRRLITALFWLVIFAGLWLSLRIPPFHPVVFDGGVVRAVATQWSALLMAWSAAALGVFTAVREYLEHRRRASAWPRELWKLISPLPAWPGFRYSAGMVAVVVLVLGCVYVTHFWTALAAFTAGAAVLTLVARQWEENLADVGLALFTLGVVSLVSFWRPASGSQYFPETFNRVLIGLAIMTAFWHWLADVWVQQLDQGVAWTTAGRLIRTARRVGFLVAATGFLVSMNLAAWPLLPHAGFDDSLWRWVWGLLANGLFILALAFATLRTGKATLAWMCCLVSASAGLFVMSRIRGTAFWFWWSSYWPILLAGLAGMAVVLAAAIRKHRRWSPFWEPIYLAGVLILPMLAIMGVSLIEQLLLPQGVPAAVFAVLAGVYALAAWLPGPRGYLVAAAICAVFSVYMCL